MKDVDVEIEKLSARRHEIWAGAPSEPGEVQGIARKLADLYELRRIQNASTSPGQSRSEVIRRARVESELERLMSR